MGAPFLAYLSDEGVQTLSTLILNSITSPLFEFLQRPFQLFFPPSATYHLSKSIETTSQLFPRLLYEPI